MQIHLKECNVCFEKKKEIYLYEQRNWKCLGQRGLKELILTPMRINLLIVNHLNVDGVIATLIHEIGHMLLPYYHQHNPA